MQIATSSIPHDPIIAIVNGQPMADSRDVASYFMKDHRRVLQTIRELHCSDGFRAHHFVPFKINDLTGETTSHVMMTKDGFAFLAMGFTGAGAARFKEDYIGRFNAMETELRSRPAVDAIALLSDPETLLNLLGTYAQDKLRLQGQVAEMRPQVEALDRIAEAHGSFCRSTAAKMLQVPPMTLIRWMRTNHWTFTRPGTRDDLAYQSKIAAGLLEHKVSTGDRADGTTWSSTQVRVTPKGLAALAKAFPPAASAA